MNKLSHEEFQTIQKKREALLKKYLEDVTEEGLARYSKQIDLLDRVVTLRGVACGDCLLDAH